MLVKVIYGVLIVGANCEKTTSEARRMSAGILYAVLGGIFAALIIIGSALQSIAEELKAIREQRR